MTFSTYHKIFINVITNNIHRSPKLIPLSAFYLRRPAADPLVWRQRRAGPAGRQFSRRGGGTPWFPPSDDITSKQAEGGTLSGQLGLSLPVAFSPPAPHYPPPQPNALFEHLHLELIPLKWMCTLGDDISLSGANSHSVCVPRPLFNT